ncbi:hypothetical protein LCGC14_1640370 [marine sediment metagenome]|uniref:Uncharacterized protein n=1 Tax=marine sediment metagenome TaxID=412755 RepID=A0A0F9HZQ6_9ZZZZ
MWCGENTNSRMKSVASKLVPEITDKYRIVFQKKIKISSINNAITIYERDMRHTSETIYDGDEPIDFKAMLGCLQNMNDIEDEEEFERKKVGFTNRIRNKADVIEDKVSIPIFLRWEELAKEAMKILHKIKELEEESAKLMERKEAGEFVKDLLKKNKKELNQLRKKEFKIYSDSKKELRSEREQMDYIICPNCEAINRKPKKPSILFRGNERASGVLYPMPPMRSPRSIYVCFNCGNLLLDFPIKYQNLKNRLDKYALRNFTEEDKLVLQKFKRKKVKQDSFLNAFS